MVKSVLHLRAWPDFGVRRVAIRSFSAQHVLVQMRLPKTRELRAASSGIGPLEGVEDESSTLCGEDRSRDSGVRTRRCREWATFGFHWPLGAVRALERLALGRGIGDAFR